MLFRSPVLSLGGGEVRTLGAPLTLALTRGGLSGKVQAVGAADAGY